MSAIPHPDAQPIAVACAVITVSDSRSPDTDRSGQLIQSLLQGAGHRVVEYAVVPDEPEQIQVQLNTLCQRPDLEALIFNGGTGIAPRDTTYDAIARSLDKTLPGFGEIFRWLSFQDIGSRASVSGQISIFVARFNQCGEIGDRAVDFAGASAFGETGGETVKIMLTLDS
jgi:molybdopterin adenylyltransferase